MPEPMTTAYLRTTQQIIIAVPPGPWEPVPNDYGIPDAIGPISYLECFQADPVPVIEFVRHAREALPRYVGEVSRQQDEITRLRAEVAAARQFAQGMRNLGVAVHYADQLVAVMDRAKGGARHGR
jgi:hypothetical protein